MRKVKFTTFASFILAVLLSNIASAQKVSYTGTVLEGTASQPLIGATVALSDFSSGTITDVDGRFSIEAEPGNVLVVSYTGYSTQQVTLGAVTELSIVLEASEVLLEQVVVVGYGSQKTKDLTSAIAVLSAEDLAKTPNSQAMQALQGKVAGVQIVSSGRPGAGPTVRIRGVGSYPGSNNESPLYVVDGAFFDNIDFLSPNEIERISVLKDASAAAIYGVRAANGVVIIETKTGKIKQKAQIEYDGYMGTQVAQNVLKMANAEQFTTFILETGSAADASYIDNAMQRYGRSRINPNVPDVNTDWYREILRDAPISNHSLSIRGGGNEATYAVSGNFFRQEGILDMKNEYERVNLRAKVDYQATDWLKVGGNVLVSNATSFLPDNGAFFSAYFAVPILPVYDEQNTAANPINLANAQDLGYRGGQNPFAATLFSENRQKSRNIVANFFAEVELIPNTLKFRTAYNHNFVSGTNRGVFLPYYFGNGFQRANSVINRSTSVVSNQIIDNTLTFDKSIGNHNIQVLGGHSYRDESFEFLRAQGLNFPAEQTTAWYIDQAETVPVDGVGDGASRQYGISYFTRLAYNYKSKYLLYGTFRADATNKYQEKWGYFPTVGVGWVVSEENFFNIPGIDYFKIRGSWGELGNDKIAASDGAFTTRVVTTAINDVLVSGTTVSSAFSALRWETVEETNFGFSSYFLGERLSLEFDYYSRDTKDAVIPVNIPAIGGTIRRNVGVIRNSGIEVNLGWNSGREKDFWYAINGNFSTLNNEVIDLYGQSHIDGGSAEFRQRSIVGSPVLAFFGREVQGVYQTQAEIDADPVAVANRLQPGDLKFKDQNGDGLVDDDDRVVLGSYLPNLIYGGSLTMGYKNFDLSLNIFGQSGNKILNRKRGEVIFTNDTNIDADLAVNRWHGAGTSDRYPSAAGVRKGWNQRLSDYFIEDGSFFRLQNVQVGYTLRGANVGVAGFPDIRFNFTADRPWTSFTYNGFNPEVADGIDRQTYPIPAIYTFGANVKF